MNLTDEIKESFRQGTILTKLIYINLGVFLIVKLAFAFYFLFFPVNEFVSKQEAFDTGILSYISLPYDFTLFIKRPWTLLTYMFLHTGFLHIFFNMLVLFWFGRIFTQYLTQKQMLSTYMLGGLFGGIFFMLAYNFLPGLYEVNRIPTLLGASAGVMAILIAIAVYNPNYEVYMLIIGRVKIKYIALGLFLMDLILNNIGNAGGHIAHLGGALYGFLFAYNLQKGKDMGRSFERIMDSLASLFKRRSRMKVAYKSKARGMSDEEYNHSKAASQKEMDRILDKIAKAGYDSLTKKEKELLFKMSDKK